MVCLFPTAIVQERTKGLEINRILLSCYNTENTVLEKGITQPLILSSAEKRQDEDEDNEYDISEEHADEKQQPVTSIVAAYRLLTPSVKVTDFILSRFLICLS